jgi:phosphopantetheine--protein transferase-like protein
MLGVDLIYIPEFKKQMALGGKEFLKKVFHPAESKNQKAEHLAGIWAAKEAVIKATGLKPGNWLDIIIKYDKYGRPTAYFNKLKFEISIAHHGEYVVAVALREKS